ncbi:fumarylacetoacetate hydrolase family protein-like protein [Aaosphaeria arxii CBS 175.79]|uniref:Fumarylacetoacetate hydrolase family protein-like protein n=1 Tax=Aaosphaeria arxii CBS 175.79 TaxID=1450172 RepID=A0A6A5YA99_9PLEO|nr:fumarylacetoacetate hydrolase family protein-like protein [Aaosphaeria arxii CBS 175.79]KAF2022368.1 fumarylacetoacetate hydrolase family protein-like protein [Aaosphaeria arxii CBS 175.79]
MPSWKRLIRFEATDGRILRGEPVLPSEDFDVGSTTEATGLKAKVIDVKDGDIFSDGTTVTNEEVTVKKLLGPVTTAEVPIIRCIGLNFIKHIKEGGRTLPPYPATFIKANTALNDHGAPIVIPKLAQDSQADYEGELCFIISKDAKDVTEADAPNYIGGYFSGNDVSSRKLQRNPELAGTVPQWNFSKGFDTYCPVGPQIVSPEVLPDPSVLQLTTTVNGEIRQNETIDDLCFRVPYLVSYISQGTTLSRGTIVMTGTPSGVGYAMKNPQFLQPGDQVEVKLWPHIGTLKNPVEYASTGFVVPPQDKQ